MKKKLCALALCVIMVVALAAPAFADSRLQAYGGTSNAYLNVHGSEGTGGVDSLIDVYVSYPNSNDQRFPIIPYGNGFHRILSRVNTNLCVARDKDLNSYGYFGTTLQVSTSTTAERQVVYFSNANPNVVSTIQLVYNVGNRSYYFMPDRSVHTPGLQNDAIWYTDGSSPKALWFNHIV